MAALDFPSSPTDGQTYTANGSTWTYNSATTSWLATNSGLPGTLTVPEGGTGLTSLAGGRIPFGNGTSAFGSSANLSWSDTYTQLSVGGSSWVSAMLSVVGNTPTTSNFSEAFVVAPTLHAACTSGSHIMSWLYTEPATALTSHTHYMARQGTLGAGTTITDQYGYIASSTLTSATNNYGFYSNIASGTGRWNFYANGTAANYFAGATTFNAAVTMNTALAIGSGGTGKTTAPAARDALAGYTTTAKSAGTTTLTNTSTYTQFFTGASTHTVTMPDATTLTLGWSYRIVNLSAADLTVRASGAVFVYTIPAYSVATLTTVDISAAVGNWYAIVDGFSVGTVPVANGGTGSITATGGFDNLAPTTALGDTIYHNGTDNVRLAGNTTATRQFLRQTGTGAVSAAPAWDTVTKTDVGLANVENTALSTWAGSANITTLGTIGTGTWSATTIAVNKGGTGATTLTGLVKGNGTSAFTAAVAGTDYMLPTGIVDNSDAYINCRVVRNSNSSASNDGIFLGYGNSNSGITRVYGGGGTTNYSYITTTGYWLHSSGNAYLHTGAGMIITAGFTVTSYNAGTGSGTFTPSGTQMNYQYLTNNGAFTIAAPGFDGAIDILVTNGASAGAITMSGFTAPTGGGGDTYATTNANRYLLMIRRINGVSTYAWKALQ